MVLFKSSAKGFTTATLAHDALCGVFRNFLGEILVVIIARVSKTVPATMWWMVNTHKPRGVRPGGSTHKKWSYRVWNQKIEKRSFKDIDFIQSKSSESEYQPNSSINVDSGNGLKSGQPDIDNPSPVSTSDNNDTDAETGNDTERDNSSWQCREDIVVFTTDILSSRIVNDNIDGNKSHGWTSVALFSYNQTLSP